jgi:enoyl-CoA hydratase/carnithine racemase
MDYETVIVERKEQVGLITLNRPEKLNTFSLQLATDLNSALKELDQDTMVRVVIIKAAGKAFCAGIDVSELAGKSVVGIRDWVRAEDEHNLTIANMKKPVIASVQGAAVANGCGLVAACDLAIASEEAKFGTTGIRIGLFCLAPGYQVLASVGRKRAMEMVLTGDIISAVEAERIGLVNKVVPPEKLEEVTMELAEKLATKSPVALQMGKTAFYKMQSMGYEAAMAYLSGTFALLCATDDAHEGVEAFLNKRAPQFKEQLV